MFKKMLAWFRDEEWIEDPSPKENFIAVGHYVTRDEIRKAKHEHYFELTQCCYDIENRKKDSELFEVISGARSICYLFSVLMDTQDIQMTKSDLNEFLRLNKEFNDLLIFTERGDGYISTEDASRKRMMDPIVSKAESLEKNLLMMRQITDAVIARHNRFLGGIVEEESAEGS